MAVLPRRHHVAPMLDGFKHKAWLPTMAASVGLLKVGVIGAGRVKMLSFPLEGFVVVAHLYAQRDEVAKQWLLQLGLVPFESLFVRGRKDLTFISI